VRDQWHTMTRTGLSPKLASHMPDPFVEVNPDDGRSSASPTTGSPGLARRHGKVVLRVNVTAAQVPGRIFVPIHWNDETAGRARAGALVHPFTDPHSGQPDLKAVPAALAPVCFAADGFVLARTRVPLPGDTVFAWTAIEGGYAARFATNESFAALFETFAARSPAAEQASYNDPARGIFRTALILHDRLDTVLFLGGTEKCRRGAVLPRHGGSGGSTLSRAAFSWLAGARPPISMQAPQSARALASNRGPSWRRSPMAHMFDRGGRRAPQCRHKLRILPARAEGE
jgi:hypothetical protein